MRIIGTRSEVVFDLESLCGTHRTTAHAQRMVHYPAMARDALASDELKAQAEHLRSSYYIFESVKGIRRFKRRFELLIQRLEWDEAGRTWESFDQMKEDIPGMVEDYLHTAGDRNLRRTALSL